MVLVISITVILGRYYHLKMSYLEIESAMSAEKVLEIMGEPNTIYDYGKERKNQTEWQYYQFPIPTVYSITIEEGVVINKVMSISP